MSTGQTPKSAPSPLLPQQQAAAPPQPRKKQRSLLSFLDEKFPELYDACHDCGIQFMFGVQPVTMLLPDRATCSRIADLAAGKTEDKLAATKMLQALLIRGHSLDFETLKTAIKHTPNGLNQLFQVDFAKSRPNMLQLTNGAQLVPVAAQPDVAAALGIGLRGPIPVDGPSAEAPTSQGREATRRRRAAQPEAPKVVAQPDYAAETAQLRAKILEATLRDWAEWQAHGKPDSLPPLCAQTLALFMFVCDFCAKETAAALAPAVARLISGEPIDFYFVFEPFGPAAAQYLVPHPILARWWAERPAYDPVRAHGVLQNKLLDVLGPANEAFLAKCDAVDERRTEVYDVASSGRPREIPTVIAKAYAATAAAAENPLKKMLYDELRFVTFDKFRQLMGVGSSSPADTAALQQLADLIAGYLRSDMPRVLGPIKSELAAAERSRMCMRFVNSQFFQWTPLGLAHYTAFAETYEVISKPTTKTNCIWLPDSAPALQAMCKASALPLTGNGHTKVREARRTLKQLKGQGIDVPDDFLKSLKSLK